tara:strand:+ start:1038 stop:1775 length:738 start_codon:yes stop_codon:yes gene_type:complete
MGFLNHATNNIIIDAVLTDKGREFLSRNDGSFKISKFRLSDDEVDYSIVEQYGVPLGKEKIEKNTPIFEALTSENLALKYPLITLDNNTEVVFAYPDIVLDGTSLPIKITTYADSPASSKEATIRIKTSINQDSDFNLSKASLVDDFFKVKVFNKLLKVSNADTLIDTKNDITTYGVSLTANSKDFTGQVGTEIVVTAEGITNDSSFNYYSLASDRTIIKTQIQIIGNRTNSTLIVPITITNTKL